MSPTYVFRIDEFGEHPDVAEQVDNEGKWLPWTHPGYNIRTGGGVSGMWWLCNGRNILHIPGGTVPEGSTLYKVFSTVYSDGHGFWSLRGDATAPPESQAWHHLSFDWDPTDLSSSLTNAGTERALRVQNTNARWPRMLLPETYHGPHYPEAGYGGLTGELPIFLALIALSMRPERLPRELPNMMQNGDWGVHNRSHGRSDKRGVIVYVYTVNGNDEELEAYEDGNFGNYYN